MTGPEDARDLEALQHWVNGRPLARALHLRCVHIHKGSAAFSFDPPDSWRNPNGSLPGAVLAAAADHSCGFAAMSVTGRLDYIATVDLGLHFLRPAFAAPVVSETIVLRHGRRLIFLVTEIRDPAGQLVATGMSTYAVDAGKGEAFPIGTGGADGSE